MAGEDRDYSALMMPSTSQQAQQAAVGVFDSGIGGLSVLKHLRQRLPQERMLYLADSAYAPYGERSVDELIERSIKITEYFLQQGIKAMVIACNTATAAAVAVLRTRYPDLLIIGMEPGLKPAALQSKNKIVGVLATRSTLQSEKFRLLREQLTQEMHTQFIPQACVGLVNQIEMGDLYAAGIHDLLRQYIPPLLAQDVDTLVLGCTHYPFVETQIRQVITEVPGAQKSIQIIDTGEAVARRLESLLSTHDLLRATSLGNAEKSLVVYATGKTETLQAALGFILAPSEMVQVLCSEL